MKKSFWGSDFNHTIVVCLLVTLFLILMPIYLNAVLPFQKSYEIYSVNQSTSNSDFYRSNSSFNEPCNTHYILNTRSKIIHFPNCQSVKLMSDKNICHSSDYDNAITLGYRPCKHCNPQVDFQSPTTSTNDIPLSALARCLCFRL